MENPIISVGNVRKIAGKLSKSQLQQDPLKSKFDAIQPWNLFAQPFLWDNVICWMHAL